MLPYFGTAEQKEVKGQNDLHVKTKTILFFLLTQTFGIEIFKSDNIATVLFTWHIFLEKVIQQILIEWVTKIVSK